MIQPPLVCITSCRMLSTAAGCASADPTCMQAASTCLQCWQQRQRSLAALHTCTGMVLCMETCRPSMCCSAGGLGECSWAQSNISGVQVKRTHGMEPTQHSTQVCCQGCGSGFAALWQGGHLHLRRKLQWRKASLHSLGGQQTVFNSMCCKIGLLTASYKSPLAIKCEAPVHP